MSKTEQTVIIPSSEADREKIRKVIRDITDEWTIIESHKAVVKEAIDALAKEYSLPKKYVRKMARTMYLQNFKEQDTEHEEFNELYSRVIERKDRVDEDEPAESLDD